MKKTILLIIMTYLCCSQAFSRALCDTCFYHEEKSTISGSMGEVVVVKAADCRKATDNLQELEHDLYRLKSGIYDICSFDGMDECIPKDEKVLLNKYKKDLDRLSDDIKSIHREVLNKVCIAK